MKTTSIILHPCGYFESTLLDQVSADIGRFFNVSTEMANCHLDMNDYYNPSRRQYDANLLVRRLSRLTTPGGIKVMGLLRVDLFVPILTYIFGQAELGGNTGVASLYRLRNELYGLEINSSLLAERFRKVIIHETGHLYGLVHCQSPGCLMRSSTYVEDLDQKDFRFCSTCMGQLRGKD